MNDKNIELDFFLMLDNYSLYTSLRQSNISLPSKNSVDKSLGVTSGFTDDKVKKEFGNKLNTNKNSNNYTIYNKNNIESVYLVSLRVLNKKDNSLVYGYIYYPEILEHSLFSYLLLKHRFKTFNE